MHGPVINAFLSFILNGSLYCWHLSLVHCCIHGGTESLDFRTWIFESRVATTQIPHPQSDLIYLVYENIDWLIDEMTIWSHGSLRNVEYVLCTVKTWITGTGGKTVTNVEFTDSQLLINITSQDHYFRGFVFVYGISANSLDAEIP